MPILDLSYLPPEERIELGEQLRGSSIQKPSNRMMSRSRNVRHRDAELAADEDSGEAGDRVLKGIAEPGE